MTILPTHPPSICPHTTTEGWLGRRGTGAAATFPSDLTPPPAAKPSHRKGLRLYLTLAAVAVSLKKLRRILRRLWGRGRSTRCLPVTRAAVAIGSLLCGVTAATCQRTRTHIPRTSDGTLAYVVARAVVLTTVLFIHHLFIQPTASLPSPASAAAFSRQTACRACHRRGTARATRRKRRQHRADLAATDIHTLFMPILPAGHGPTALSGVRVCYRASTLLISSPWVFIQLTEHRFLHSVLTYTNIPKHARHFIFRHFLARICIH